VTLTEAGFPDCFVPKRWGGAAATFDAVTKAVATVGEGCPSAAWISSLWAYNGRFGAYLPPEGQEEVWVKGPGTRIVSSMIAVGAEAQPCPGGWMLSGSWLYVSGVESADWALISSGLPREGDRHTRVLAVPKESFTHTNTWSTIGMRATGSHTLIVERAFVQPPPPTLRPCSRSTGSHSPPRSSVPPEAPSAWPSSTSAPGQAGHGRPPVNRA
jgi:two-component flavin-dependent monooxygenase